jgi:dienelactone hydrolase
MKIGVLIATALALGVGSTAAAQQPAPPSDFARAQAEADKVPDTAGDGPYPATMEVDPGLPNYVVYRPADLSNVGRGKLGVFVWGNGACADDATSARQQLAEIASYGYLVIAPGKWQSGPNARDPRPIPQAPAAGGKIPPPATSAADLARALDWALAEDRRQGSRYSGMIDRQAIALGGYSCGGLQALQLAADPRIRTLVIQNSGIFRDASLTIPGMMMSKDQLKAIHTPVLYLLGGTADIAYGNGTDDFARIDHVPAVLINIPTGHGGTYGQPMGGKGARIVTAWLQWQLRHDRQAARTFVGKDCTLCRDSDATIERKNLR